MNPILVLSSLLFLMVSSHPSHPDPCLVLVSSCSISTTSGSGNSLIVHWPITNTPECCQRAFSTQWFAFACTCGFSPGGRGCRRRMAEWREAGHWAGKATRVGIKLFVCLSRLNEIDSLSSFCPVFLKICQHTTDLTLWICIFVIYMDSLVLRGNLRLCVHVCIHACMCVCVWVCAK